MNDSLPRDFKFLLVKDYSGSDDPREHITRYHYAMMACGTTDFLMCQGFPNILSGPALRWLLSLPVECIHRFMDLEERFLRHFSSQQRRSVTIQGAMNILQRNDESLDSYIKRFSAYVIQDTNFTSENAMMALKNGLLNQSSFKQELGWKQWMTYEEALELAKEFIASEELNGILLDPPRDDNRRKGWNKGKDSTKDDGGAREEASGKPQFQFPAKEAWKPGC